MLTAFALALTMSMGVASAAPSAERMSGSAPGVARATRGGGGATGKTFAIPFSEDFNAGTTLPEGWEENVIPATEHWVFQPKFDGYPNTDLKSGNAATIGGTVMQDKSWIQSPKIDVQG